MTKATVCQYAVHVSDTNTDTCQPLEERPSRNRLRSMNGCSSKFLGLDVSTLRSIVIDR